MNFIDELIQHAQKRGEFDNLPGSGHPIKFDDAQYGKETHMAYKMLKDNGYSLAFIEERKVLIEKTESLRAQLQKASGRYDDSIGGRLAWRRTTNSFRQRVAKLNQSIRDYNLKAPRTQFQVMPLDADREIANVR